MAFTVGIDVGGTKILGGVVDERGKVLKTARKDTPRQGGSALTQSIADVFIIAYLHRVTGFGLAHSHRDLGTLYRKGFAKTKRDLFDAFGAEINIDHITAVWQIDKVHHEFNIFSIAFINKPIKTFMLVSNQRKWITANTDITIGNIIIFNVSPVNANTVPYVHMPPVISTEHSKSFVFVVQEKIDKTFLHTGAESHVSELIKIV